MKREAMLDADESVQTTLAILAELLDAYPARDFAVRLWDGTTWDAEVGQPTRFTLVLQHPGSLRRMFLPPTELKMAEAYIYNDIDIEGDICAIYPLAEYFKEMQRTFAEKLRLGRQLRGLPSGRAEWRGRRAADLTGMLHSRERDKHAVRYHYNTSNEFFKLFLDKNLVYSCAYFESLNDDLDTAQCRKLDYICRKLRLRKDDRLLDIGCGWGGLVIHAARHYGVKALGITLSEPQAELANRRIHEEGLERFCSVEVRDYRELDQPARYEKLVSIGMIEHVGEMLLPQYFHQAHRLLRSGGVFLNHGIARNDNVRLPQTPTFSDLYVFPDSELIPLHTVLREAEQARLEVRDVESLREHYAMTLQHWGRHLQAHHAEAVAATDETTFRVWRLFMSGSAHRFWNGELNVYQTLLVKSDDGASQLPLMRKDWYSDSKTASVA